MQKKKPEFRKFSHFKKSVRRKESLLSRFFEVSASIFSKFSRYFHRKPAIGYVALTMVLMFGVFFMEKGSEIFQASILNESSSFDGTAMPFREIPNWYSVGGKSGKIFSEYSSSELLSAPKYDLATLQSTAVDATTRNAQITYSTVYMGNYHMDHREKAGSHPAIDIKLPEGTPIYAIANGVITKAEEKTTGFGKVIVIRHDNVPQYGTLFSGYGHLSEVNVSVGQVVKKGDLIGKSGNTGSSTAPHMHFQIDRDSAPWHPWWPFSTTDAEAAGVSFWEGVNVSLGQAAAIQNTVHPMNFVQEHLSFTPSSGGTSSGKSSPVIFELASIEMTASVKEIPKGQSFEISLQALDAAGKIATGENAEVQLSTTDHDITVPTLRLQNGTAKATIISRNIGRVYLDATYKKLQKRVSVKVIESSTDTNNGAPASTIAPITQDGEFSKFEISGEQKGVIGKTILLDIRALDSDGKRTKNVPTKGGFPVIAENGTVSKEMLTANDFQNGLTTIEFLPTARGKASVSIGEIRWEMIIDEVAIKNASEIVKFAFEGGNFVKGVQNDFFIVSVDANGERTAQTPFGNIAVDLQEGTGEIKTPKLTGSDFENGKAKVVIVPESDRISLRARSGVIVGEKRFSADSSKIFVDVSQKDSHATAIAYLKEKGVIAGYSDGTFQPKKTISRAETLKMIFLTFGVDQETTPKSAFSDIKNGEWYSPFVLSASAIGLVSGYLDGTFRPTQTIVRAEYFKVLLKAIEAPISTSLASAPFVDVSPSSWEAPYAKYAKNESLLDFGAKFYPDQEITREEVAETIYRIAKTQE